MSTSAMKQAIQALEFFCEYGVIDRPFERIAELKQAIEQAEKQEPVAYVSGYHGGNCVVTPINPAVVFSVGTAFSYTAPVHASDMSKERVDETPKCKDDPRAPHGFDRNASHSADRYVCECEGWEPPKEWVGLDDDIPGLGLVTEEFYNGMLCAEDILRKQAPVKEPFHKEWVDLTQEEVDEIYAETQDEFQFSQLLAYKLREKNSGWNGKGWEPPPEPPLECQTDPERTAFAFGWWKAMETKRQWVGLTDQETQYLVKHFDWRQSADHFVAVIEAKLKAKNGG